MSNYPARPAAPTRARPRRTTITDDQKAEAVEAFRIFDSRRTGRIGHQEVRTALVSLGFDVTKDDVHDLIRRYGSAETGEVDQEAFVRIYTEKVLARDPVQEMVKAFQLFDDDSTGRITIRNLRRIVRELEMDIPDSELQDMLDEFSSAGDGTVTQQDFIAMLQEAAALN